MTGLVFAVARAAELVGSGVVSTGASEIRAAPSPDGATLVWGSADRTGGPGGWDLWQARRDGESWVDPQPLPIDTPAKEFDPVWSADGRWLFFFSDRPGGFGGDDLYRVAVDGWGTPENLGAGVNTPGNEWAPTPSEDGQELLFASDGHGGAGRHDLFVARWQDGAFAAPVGLAVNTAADEFDAAWVDGGRVLVFARSANVDEEPIRLWVSACDGTAWGPPEVWDLPLNTADGYTLGPVAVDRRTMLVSGADASGVGRRDIYRVDRPAVRGRRGCTP